MIFRSIYDRTLNLNTDNNEGLLEEQKKNEDIQKTALICDLDRVFSTIPTPRILNQFAVTSLDTLYSSPTHLPNNIVVEHCMWHLKHRQNQ